MTTFKDFGRTDRSVAASVVVARRPVERHGFEPVRRRVQKVPDSVGDREIGPAHRQPAFGLALGNAGEGPPDADTDANGRLFPRPLSLKVRVSRGGAGAPAPPFVKTGHT